MKNQSENDTEMLKKDNLQQQSGIVPLKKAEVALAAGSMQPFAKDVSHFKPSFIEPAKVVMSNLFSTVEKYAGLNRFACVSRSLVFYSWKDYA